MNRRSMLLGGSLEPVLVLSGWLADRALLERRTAVEEGALDEARETARLAALTLRATLAEIELSVVADAPRVGVKVERVALPPSRTLARGLVTC